MFMFTKQALYLAKLSERVPKVISEQIKIAHRFVYV
jgi:hypothetical protein